MKISELKRIGFVFLLFSLAWAGGCATNSSAGGAGSVASTAPTVTSAPTPFVMYDNTYYPNSSSVFETAGTMRAAVLYSQSAWPGTCTASGCPNAPTQAQFLSSLEAYVKEFGTSNAIIFDYESLVVSQETSTAAASNAVALFLQMIAWTRAVYPNAKIGMYDYDWSSNYNSSSSTGYNAIRAQLFKGGTASFDFFAPTMYQRWSTHSLWDQNLAQAIINDSAINQENGTSLPIYAYVSPYVSGNYNGSLLADSEWSSELADLMSCNLPSSTACSSIMSTLSSTTDTCAGSSSSKSCTATGGGILWVGTSTTNLDASAQWVSDVTSILSPAPAANVVYQIASSGSSPLCIDANAGTIPSANSCGTQASQEWTLNSLGTGFYSINSFGFQQANPSGGSVEVLDGTSATVVSTQLSSSAGRTAYQQWQVVSLGGKYYELVKLADYSTVGNTDSEECLTAGASEAVLTTSVCSFAANQIFLLTPK